MTCRLKRGVSAASRLRALSAVARGSHGVRGAALLAVATIAMSGAGYIFNVACIRYLGPAEYADVATMIALIAVVALPLGSVQLLLAREVAQISDLAAVTRVLRRSVALASLVGVLLFGVGLAFVTVIQSALKIESPVTVIAGLSGLVFAVVAAILYGFLQGRQRFGTLALIYGASGLARPVLVVPALFAGLGAAGALGVNALAGALAVVVAGLALGRLWRVAPAAKSPLLARRHVAVMLVASLAFASLTNLDIVLASYFLADDAAGIYAAAALVGKFVLLLPSAIVMVLLPKAAFRAARGAASHRILLASAGVTAVVTLSLAAALAVTPESVLVWAFGPAFRSSTALLGWFGLAMSAAALVNVYLSVYLAYRDLRFPALVMAAAVAQVTAVALWHPDPRAIVLVTLLCFTAVIAVHELAFPHSLVRVWRRRHVAVAPGSPVEAAAVNVITPP